MRRKSAVDVFNYFLKTYAIKSFKIMYVSIIILAIATTMHLMNPCA